MSALYGKRRQINHFTQSGRLLERHKKFLDRKPVVTAGGIDLSGPAGSNDIKDNFVFQKITVFTMRPAVFQHQINPLLEQSRSAVHVERMMPDNDLMGKQQFFLPVYINIEIGILLIQII